MRKILILRGGALGDFLVTLPVLALLRNKWPQARIELVGNAPAATLALDCGLLDAAHSQHEARWSALFGAEPLPKEFAAWLATFDLVVNFWPDRDGELRARFPLRKGQRFLFGDAQPARPPAATHYCEALRPLEIEPRESFYRLSKPEGERSHIAIHPGSGSAKKNWPLDRWRELIAKLPAPPLVITGEAESGEARAFAQFGATAHNLPLRELAAHLARCRLFLGHDSGVSHLAAACGVPCVLLFGPTDPAMWAPPAPHVRVIRRGAEMSSISVDEVWQAVTAALADRK